MLYMFQAVPPPIIRSSKTVYTASVTCQTFTAACCYHGRVGNGLRVLTNAVYTVFELLMMGGGTA
jgi:hypothetical protein